eukprot:gene17334-biopygen12808
MPGVTDMLLLRQRECLKLLKRILGSGFNVPAVKTTFHYGIQIGQTQLLSICDALTMCSQYRNMRFRDEPTLSESDRRTIKLLKRVIFKNPRIRAPRVQSYSSHPNTKPFFWYHSAGPNKAGARVASSSDTSDSD